MTPNHRFGLDSLLAACSLALALVLTAGDAHASPVAAPEAWARAPVRAVASATAATTRLELRFEGDANGQSGETPTIATGLAYEAGIHGLGVQLGPGDQRHYTTAGNIDAATTFQLGADSTGAYLDAVLDELVISSGERTAEEIRDRYVNGLTVISLAADPDTLNLFPTWRIAPQLTAITNLGTVSYPPHVASWSSSNPTVAVFDAGLGEIRALAAGQAVLTATADGASTAVVVNVQAPALPPTQETIPAFLSTPAEAHCWEVPVVVLRYLPTANGTDLDTSINPDFWELGPITLANLKSRINTYDLRVKFGLEAGSRFRDYLVPARPSLGYRVVAYITVYEPTPPGRILATSGGYPVYDADYFSIFERFDIAHYVNDLGVKEVWFWSSGLDTSYPSYDPAIVSVR